MSTCGRREQKRESLQQGYSYKRETKGEGNVVSYHEDGLALRRTPACGDALSLSGGCDIGG